MTHIARWTILYVIIKLMYASAKNLNLSSLIKWYIIYQLFIAVITKVSEEVVPVSRDHTHMISNMEEDDLG